jgi:hypothetical protein
MGLAGKWRRRDMTNPRLAYAVCEARRTVTWRMSVASEPAMSQRQTQHAWKMSKVQFSSPHRGNVFRSQLDSIPVTR